MSDTYIVVNISTTCDESSLYIAKDSTEIIEFSWSIIDATSLHLITTKTNYVKPTNTPVTPYCTSRTNITWNQVKEAVGLKEVITDFDNYLQRELIDQNKEFSFVTMDLTTLRVQLPREARDKNVILPPYLQHPRVFDLHSEYCKWQAAHPEALSYSGTSLDNILTALEVEKSQPDLPKLGGNPIDNDFHNLINIHSRLLIQLIKKSLPIEDHSTILTKPYDTSHDIQVFLNERSKILYLTNLSLDITQSELELWFTQYGARPIALWHLKNLETSQPSINYKYKNKGINGFAIFATHEEATEALVINGKALNDRVIEIQPSSTRVLDKANELLAPFPPSKNRPRPGDWTCPSCGFSNFQRRTACFRCSFPATSAVTFQEQVYPPNNMVSNRRNPGFNNSSTSTIYSNQSSSTSSDKLPPSNAVMSNYQYYDTYNGHVNSRNYNGSNGNNNSPVPFRAGDWKCTNEICQYHNFAKNLVCLKCGMAKPLNLHVNSKPNQHSVNTAAAAIAAATASGQSLNFNSSVYSQMHQSSTSTNNPNFTRQSYKPNYLYQSNMSTRTTSNTTPVQPSNLMNQQYLIMSQNGSSLGNTPNNMNMNLSNSLNSVGLNNNMSTGSLNGGLNVNTSFDFNPLQSTSSIGSNQSQSQSHSTSSPSTTTRSTLSQSANNSPSLYQAFGGYSQYPNDVNFNINLSNQFSSLNLNNNKNSF